MILKPGDGGFLNDHATLFNLAGRLLCLLLWPLLSFGMVIVILRLAHYE